jgi:2-oxoglutarate dehydrogenase E2 component (dihydrolipoamide succinyltransferase)
MADVTLPQLGETVTEGTITKWFKAVGDSVALDEPLFEVSTDKVDTEVPSPIAGTVLEIRVNEGDTVQVGSVIAVVGDGAPGAGGEPAGAAAAGTAEASVPAEAPAQAPAEASVPTPEPEPAPQPAPTPQPEPPAPSPQPVPQPEPPVPAPEPVPQPEPGPAPAPPGPQPEPPPGPEPVPPPEPMPPIPQATDAGTDGAADHRLLSPVVRRLVNEYGLDPGAIKGTGAGGRITREDVLDHIERSGAKAAPAAAPSPAAAPAAQASPASAPSPAAQAAPAPAAPAPAAPAEVPSAPAAPAPAAAAPARAGAPAVQAGARDESVKLSKIRKLTGDHMIMSKAVTPHAFSVVEVDYANVDRTRSAVKTEWKASEGFSLTYLPFICRALIDGLAQFPHLNASVGENELIVHRYIDLGIAVDLDYQGLLVPVIRDAETKRLRAIAREISDLAGRAKSRKLSPDEIQGGTFTVSNNGSAGSVLTAPIINQPQVAIVSTDAITRKPVVIGLPDGSEGIAIHPVGNLAMSWDHRAFDGAYAANFLHEVKTILETRDWDAEL